MKKTIFTAVGFFFLGAVVATLILFSQIQNRYNVGYNDGKIDGGFRVLTFLKKSVQNDTIKKEVIQTKKYLGVKYKGIYVIKIDGVETVKIIE